MTSKIILELTPEDAEVLRNALGLWKVRLDKGRGSTEDSERFRQDKLKDVQRVMKVLGR